MSRQCQGRYGQSYVEFRGGFALIEVQPLNGVLAPGLALNDYPIQIPSRRQGIWEVMTLLRIYIMNYVCHENLIESVNIIIYQISI